MNEKGIWMHKRVRELILTLSPKTRRKIGETLRLLQLGLNVSLPISRPMPVVSNGVHELRVRDPHGAYRIFYFLGLPTEIVVFHAFSKKNIATPMDEITTARKRLKEMSDGRE